MVVNKRCLSNVVLLEKLKANFIHIAFKLKLLYCFMFQKLMCKSRVQALFFLLTFNTAFSQSKINRQQLIQRHTVKITSIDSLSSLSVGNGRFAFTVDATGLQTFPKKYEKGIPLGTESEWGWHSFIDTSNFKREEAIKMYPINGRDIGYTVQWNSPQRNKDAANWFRQNPHRLQLGNVGFEITKKDGGLISPGDVKNIDQQLDMWTGEIKSHFTIEGIAVDVSTFCDQDNDQISVQVKSDLIKEERLKIYIHFPYPTGEWSDVGTNYNKIEKHSTIANDITISQASIVHQLDSTKYFADLNYSKALLIEKEKHYFLIAPLKSNSIFEFTCRFSIEKNIAALPSFSSSKSNNAIAWENFWSKGAAVDFAGSTDPRAFELERRIILSQYLIKIQETGQNPPQETGLTYNSWFGKPHLEMPYWHLSHYAFWNHDDLLEKNLDYYFKVFDKAKALAKRQGFEGARWQKMTDNNGDEAPSSVGAFLIWNEPHLIYFAESIYRDKKDVATLNKFKDLVFATADFMASYPFYQKEKDRYILGKGVIAAQERFKAEETFNPAYELVYWHWALDIAQQWRERLHLPHNKKWDEVLQKLSALPTQNNMYLPTESATDAYTNPEFRTDHPSVLAAFGVMPATGQVDKTIMKNTFNWIWNNWTWKDTWGWDYAMVAMTATRLGMSKKAIDALMMNVQKNTYLVNGHNYQDDRLRLYLPGNGGLLSAIALMCAGYDGCKEINPGIPKNGKWKVKWEGLKKLP